MELLLRCAADAVARRTAEIAERHRLISEYGPDRPVLNLAHATYTASLPGEVAINDVFLYAMMWRGDELDEEPVVRSIQRRDYGAIAVNRTLLSSIREPFAGKRWMRVMNAAAAYYPCRARSAEVVLFFPPGACKRRASATNDAAEPVRGSSTRAVPPLSTGKD